MKDSASPLGFAKTGLTVGIRAGIVAGLVPGIIAVALATVPTSSADAAVRGTLSSCRDARGTPVWQYKDERLRNVAIATRLRDGRPIMVFNPRIMARFSPITQRFWYFHECAHHALGHSLGHRPASRERDSDCWAIRQMKQRGLLRGQNLAIIQADMRRLGGDGHLYLPGPERARHLNACLNYTAHLYNNPQYRAHARYNRNRSNSRFAGIRKGEGYGVRRRTSRPTYTMTTPNRRLPFDSQEGDVGQNYRLPRATSRAPGRVLPPGGAGERRASRNSINAKRTPGASPYNAPSSAFR